MYKSTPIGPIPGRKTGLQGNDFVRSESSTSIPSYHSGAYPGQGPCWSLHLTSFQRKLRHRKAMSLCLRLTDQDGGSVNSPRPQSEAESGSVPLGINV